MRQIEDHKQGVANLQHQPDDDQIGSRNLQQSAPSDLRDELRNDRSHRLVLICKRLPETQPIFSQLQGQCGEVRRSDTAIWHRTR